MDNIENTDKWIKENYKNYTKPHICDLLKINIRDLRRKAKELGVLNLELSNRRIKQNKEAGRDLSYDNLKEIALKYKTRGIFQIMDSSAYSTARRLGYLNNICSHMISMSYSIPQIILAYYLKQLIGDDYLYNTRKIISPYEIDIYYTKYRLGFEYNGKGWHTDDNKRDMIKREKYKEYELTIIDINENSRKYEEDIKNQLINNLKLINALTKLTISKSDVLSLTFYENILNDMIIDKELIRETVSKYSTLKDFREGELKLYNYICRHNLLSYISKLNRCRYLWTDEMIINESSKYEYISDFYTKSNDCYLFVKKHHKEYLISKLKYKKVHIRNLDDDLIELKLMDPIPNTKYKLRRDNSKLFSSLKRKVGLDDLSKLLIDLQPK